MGWMLEMRGVVLCLSGSVAIAACGDNGSGTADPTNAGSSSSGDIDPTTPAESSSSGEVASTDSSSSETTAGMDTSTDSGSSSESESSESTTVDEPELPTCDTEGCPDGEWCMRIDFQTDTDGEGSYESYECVPLPRECVGLTEVALAMCLEPLCCRSWGCPTSIDETEMEFTCVEDPSQSCGSCNF